MWTHITGITLAQFRVWSQSRRNAALWEVEQSDVTLICEIQMKTCARCHLRDREQNISTWEETDKCEWTRVWCEHVVRPPRETGTEISPGLDPDDYLLISCSVSARTGSRLLVFRLLLPRPGSQCDDRVVVVLEFYFTARPRYTGARDSCADRRGWRWSWAARAVQWPVVHTVMVTILALSRLYLSRATATSPVSPLSFVIKTICCFLRAPDTRYRLEETWLIFCFSDKRNAPVTGKLTWVEESGECLKV